MVKIRRNNYKQNLSVERMQKRGQTSMFIIIAIVIVALAVLIYLFYPRIASVLGIESEPGSFMKTCVEPSVQENIALLAKQGGYANPEGYILYKGEKIKYLCYTSKYFLPCKVQQPLLREHFEQELETLLTEKAEECVGELRSYYEKRGYTVSQPESVSTSVDIVADSISISVNAPMTITKDETQTFRSFGFEIPSRMYSLIMTAVSIIDFESTYGDSETLAYMRYYPNLRIRKDKLGDGTTMYEVEDVNSEESFAFASRSLAWPGGYGASA